MTSDQQPLAQKLVRAYGELEPNPLTVDIQSLLTQKPQLLEYGQLFRRLYRDHPLMVAKTVSKTERDERSYRSSTLVYGEIEFIPFADVLMRIKTQYGGLQHPGGIFVDIGCGSGRPVFAAALVHDFDRCIGIELLEGLTQLCTEVENVWHVDIEPQLPERKQQTKFEFVNGDATKRDWSTADLVFANSTCFSAQLMSQLAVRANDLKPGAFFVSTTRELPSNHFELLETSKMSESWGDATIYIQRRLPEQDDEF